MYIIPEHKQMLMFLILMFTASVIGFSAFIIAAVIDLIYSPSVTFFYLNLK